jgi:hypothetical protein
MTDEEFERERREQRRLEKLGIDNPRCCTCGESDSRVLELHHIAGRKFDDAMAIQCRNCHRKTTDDAEDHPSIGPGADPLLAMIGKFLLGLADMLQLVVGKLYEFGRALICLSISGEGEPA